MIFNIFNIKYHKHTYVSSMVVAKSFKKLLLNAFHIPQIQMQEVKRSLLKMHKKRLENLKSKSRSRDKFSNFFSEKLWCTSNHSTTTCHLTFFIYIITLHAICSSVEHVNSNHRYLLCKENHSFRLISQLLQ